MLIFDLLGELVAPTRCAACEERVRPSLLFCGTCAVSVERSEEPDAVFQYGGAVADAIVRFKYRGRHDLASRLGGAMAALAAKTYGTAATRGAVARPDLVVPVPLHPRRVVERGFDQAALLAGPVAKILRAEISVTVLRRTRDTPRQATLDRDARAANVESAFICAAPARVRGRRVLLIDDVRTTGSTLGACREALREAEAASVSTLVLAARGDVLV